MSQKNSSHLLAKQDNQCGAPRPNWDAAHLVRSKEKKMEVDWPRKQNSTDIYSKNSHALDPRRKQEDGTTKRDVEKVRGARDEGSRVELGPGRKAGSGHTTMAFLGVGLRGTCLRRPLGTRRPLRLFEKLESYCIKLASLITRYGVLIYCAKEKKCKISSRKDLQTER